MSVVDERGHPPLWLALENGLEDIASTLVRGEEEGGKGESDGGRKRKGVVVEMGAHR